MLLIGRQATHTCSGRARRAFLHAGFLGALGTLGGTCPGYAASAATAAPPNGRAVILLWLWGGPPHLDTLDPKPEAPSEYRGPYRAIPTAADGIQVSELLPQLAQRMGRCALVRSLSHGSNDHGVAGATVLTGSTPAGGRVQPHMGALVSRIHGSSGALGSFIAAGEPLHQGHRPIAGEGGGVLGAVFDPLRVRYDPQVGVLLGELETPPSVPEARMQRRRRLLESALHSDSAARCREEAALTRSYRQALSLMTSSKGRQALDLTREADSLRNRYGRDRFGQSCLLARRLVEAGVRFVQVNWSQHVESEEDAGDGGWDNHYRNFEMLAERQCWPFDRACATLLDDLQDRGLLESTLVVAVGEFGRTPRINSSAGRDHWEKCYSALLAGGGVHGGQVVGASDERGEYPASHPLGPADLCATILEFCGVTRTDVLALGLPAPGEPIHALFG
jgi:hypothetical protein